MSRLFCCPLLLAALIFGGGCANVVPPGGGQIDTSAPRLLSVTPGDSALNTRPKSIELRFDEYIVLQDAAKDIQISPLLAIDPIATSDLRRVRLSIPDTLLADSTTYRISFGKAIRDLHEGNSMRPYTYVFSTGNWFDSLRLAGRVVDAATGLPDTSAIVVLHPEALGDTGIISRKPAYVATVSGNGSFEFAGLPARRLRAYALGDKNGNRIFDGSGERIAFLDTVVTPGRVADQTLVFRTFAERDSAAADSTAPASVTSPRRDDDNRAPRSFTYVVEVDTADKRRRTQELTQPLRIRFSKRIASVAPDRIFLSTDSAGTLVEVLARPQIDTADSTRLLLRPDWAGDAIYNLRLLKGFARDTSGGDALPSRWAFRTKQEDDYAILRIHLPTRFYRNGHVLQVIRDGKDTVWQRPVADTMVTLRRLTPGTFTMLVIEDRNRNGVWDPGSLAKRIQPEMIYRYDGSQSLKAGWENELDFEEAKKKGRGQPSLGL